MVLATSQQEPNTAAEVDDAFRQTMMAKSAEISFAQAVKNAQHLAAQLVDLVARPEIRNTFDSDRIGHVERLVQNILADASLLQAHNDAKQ